MIYVNSNRMKRFGGGHCQVDKERGKAFPGIEESQAELRRSIERAKALSEETERRIRRNRQDAKLPDRT